MDDSKKLWLNLRMSLPKYEVRIGSATAQSYVQDPKHIVFVSSRYKFVAKMLADYETVLEVGCCDAFGGPIVAQEVKRLICTDIDEEMLQENVSRCAPFKNMEFRYHDFRSRPYHEGVDAIYLIDVLEHIFPHEETAFMVNMTASLNPNGVMVIGTPNFTAQQYASTHSRTGHVNLKDHQTLRTLCQRHFCTVFMFSMNDEVLHTGYFPMAHYLWAICANLRAG
jgi:2-polyprenyl-3-methyl-5-hydroxy-6-metoxy-1,4-benzoquinol methylase